MHLLFFKHSDFPLVTFFILFSLQYCFASTSATCFAPYHTLDESSYKLTVLSDCMNLVYYSALVLTLGSTHDAKIISMFSLLFKPTSSVTITYITTPAVPGTSCTAVYCPYHKQCSIYSSRHHIQLAHTCSNVNEACIICTVHSSYNVYTWIS